MGVFDDVLALPKVLWQVVLLLVRVGSSPQQFFSFIVLGFGFLLLALICTPVPLLSRLGVWITKKLSFPLFRGVSCLICIGLACLTLLVLELLEYYTIFKAGANCSDLATTEQRHHCRDSRWRKERNFYTTATGAVIFLSLQKIAGLVIAKEKLE
jgi:hypothetical protein